MTDNESPRRGRPRPADAIERDSRIRALLTESGPQTRNQIASALGISNSLVYLALDRLRRSGEVRRCLREDGTSVWSTKTGEPCP
jgi:predicted ArsR family transcriptional regulator